MINEAAKMLEDFNFLNIVLSAGMVATLISTGAFIQKSQDNGTEIKALKERVKTLEDDRPKIAALVNKVDNLDDRISELREDMKQGFQDVKEMLHPRYERKN